MQILSQDSKYIWHPCTQCKDLEKYPILPISHGNGVYLYDFNGNKYTDCISSWWVNLFGHCNPYISQVLSLQAQKLEHIIFAGYTHEQIVRLSKRLIDILPTNLDKCFYADNGSSAIEIAIKMSHHLHLLQNKNCKIFVSLQDSYHGETIGALSLCDVGIYKQTYSNLLLQNAQIKTPKNNSQSELDSALDSFKSIIKKHKNNICALIIEPLIQCAGGMKMHSKIFVQEIYKLAKENDIFVIFDEIATGFGRSGEMFALNECEVVPDFLCLSKGISGGYLPLSVVITSNKIYDCFYGDYSRAFLHSHSYNGNALAAACANATLDIFERENIIEKNKILSEFIFSKWQELGEFKIVKNLRKKGMIFAFELDGNFKREISLIVSKLALKNGLILRPLGKTVYFMPPYIISQDEVRFVISGIKNILKELQ